MALDHALMRRARRTGEAVLRLYGWSVPVLSLGRNQRARGAYNSTALASRGIGVVRRPTGGRALLHHRELTYSVTAPVNESQGLGAMYRRVNHLLVNALTTMGVPAALAAPPARAPMPSGLPCFAEPGTGEIIVGGRKLAGSAQWQELGAMLQHGSILIDDDQWTIPELMHDPPTASPTPATLRQILGRAPLVEELAAAMFTAVRHLEDEDARAFTDDLSTDPERLALVEHYRHAEWTWRR